MMVVVVTVETESAGSSPEGREILGSSVPSVAGVDFLDDFSFLDFLALRVLLPERRARSCTSVSAVTASWTREDRSAG